MLFWTITALAVCGVCALLAGLLIPQVLLISFRKNLFDAPDERKIHQGAVPRLGGLVFKPVVFFSISLMMGVLYLIGWGDKLAGLAAESCPLAFGFCAIMMLYIVGLADDLIGIRYRAKFIIQILCGLAMVAGGLWISNMHGMFGLTTLSPWVGYPLTVTVVVFIINALNLIDGIDGLASGICSAATVFMGVALIQTYNYAYAVLAFGTLGVLIPFFYYNVFGDATKMKKIFMGDTGSTTIGMVLCILSLKLLNTRANDTDLFGINPFVLAYSPLIVPCFDVLRVYFHRIRHGNNPFMPDKNHIHHKLLALGMGQRMAMVSIVASSVVITAANLWASHYVPLTWLLAIDLAIWTLINVWISRKIANN